MKKHLLLAFVLISAIHIHAQWNTLGIATGNAITHCSFPSNDTGYATSGKLYRTFNGGLFFDSVVVPNISQINSIDFRTNTDGVVCGDLSLGGPGIFRTFNAGQTWADISATNAVGVAMHVKFASLTNGIFLTSAPGIYITTNSGVTWDTMTFGYDYFNTIDFPTTTTGYIGGFDGTFNYQGVIRKTTDGGVTWNLATDFNTNNTVIEQIQFVNADTGFVSYNAFSFPSHLLRTRDGAVSWDTVLFNSGQIVHFAFSDYMNGFIVNDSGSVYRTNNAGVTWMLDRLHTDYLYEINVTPSYAYSVGDNGLFNKRNLAAGIPVEPFNTELKIYPNPGADEVNLLLPHGTQIISITAMDVAGRNCGNLSFAKMNVDELKIDSRSLAKGCYILEIVGENETFKVRFEKGN